jgi:hypothetical protein
MKAVLEGRYEPVIEDLPPPKKILANGGEIFFCAKQNVRSSWSDSIIGVEFPTLPHCKKKVAAPLNLFMAMNRS